ncbi:MAG TPA: alpha/beta hydrolase [Acidimicrobiales bacterium]|nr:alpha/beta hydrolase [Acidimicrobiales bacterium]
MASYVDLGAVRMWFDEQGGGDGTTTVLLHGGTCTAETWMMQIEALGAGRPLLLPEQRGHGHTADVGEVSYELMAADTIAFIEATAGGPVDVVGWSDGGNIGLHVALRRPDLVRKLVTIGSNFHHEGTLPAFLEGAAVEDDGPDMIRELYEAASPDGPDHWPVIKGKLLEMWRTGPTLTEADLATIDRPVLVLVGDDDAVFLHHTVALYEALPHGQLAVVPGTSHLVPIEKPDLVNRLIGDFLDDGAVVSMLQMRRAESAH